MKRPGFTLIELLVVIAIIAILASILFPVFARARAKGLEMTCLSNMRQMGVALHLYQTDTNGTWTPISTKQTLPPPPGAPKNDARWWVGYDNSNISGGGDMRLPAKYRPHVGLIDPFLQSNAVKRCPAAPTQAQIIVCGSLWEPNNGPYGALEYGPFTKRVLSQSSYWAAIGAKESEFEGPAYTIVAWEHWARIPACNFIQGPRWLDVPPQDRSYKDHFQFLHYDGANVLWADGHAKRMLYDQLRRPMFGVKKSYYYK